MCNAQAIADALGGRRSGNGYRMPCPVCGGSDKATKFTATDTGDRTLVYCFAGCSFNDIVTELRARGLWPDSTPEQRDKWRTHRDQQDVEEGKTWLLVAESAVERGEPLSNREQQRYTLLRRLYGGKK